MSKLVKVSLVSIATIIVGCSSNNENVIPSTCQDGMYCYKNINFGKSTGADFEKGVRDGCRTAEGDFRKDYSMSSSSASYTNGWMLGRSKCKQVLPNEGTIQEEKNSKRRAEYQIEQMKLKQNFDSEESVVDGILNNNSDLTTEQDSEY